MRSKILVLTVALCAPTAVLALTPARPLLADMAVTSAGAATEVGGVAAGNSWRGNMILIKGDRSGTGPGKGGQKGQKKGKGNSEGKGKQKAEAKGKKEK